MSKIFLDDGGLLVDEDIGDLIDLDVAVIFFLHKQISKNKKFKSYNYLHINQRKIE